MSDLADFREQKDLFFRRSPQSPIPSGERGGFAGLNYFAESPSLAFTLPLLPADDGEITVETTDGASRVYSRAGRVSFVVEGQEATLTLYRTPGHDHGYFVPFRDATSGSETYGAGRYLDLAPAEADGMVKVDFNYAYFPFCAYDDAYSCPLPPVENWLQAPIRAGERLPADP